VVLVSWANANGGANEGTAALTETTPAGRPVHRRNNSAMLYLPNTPSVNSPSTIRGRSLRRKPRTARQRAAIAAQLVAGEIVLAGPTVGQAAALTGGSVAYTRLALRLDKTGRADLAADRSVTLPAVPKRPAPTILDSWKKLDAEGKEAFVRAVFCDLWKLIDRMDSLTKTAT